MKFTDLIVWQKSHQLFLDIVKDVEGFPRKRAADIIANQILRLLLKQRRRKLRHNQTDAEIRVFYLYENR